MPYSPGGGTLSITARLFGDQLKNILGQQFVVENKPGAFGILAIEEMAHSKPDGYTLMIGNVSTNAITPVLFKKKFQIDFEKDVVSVARMDIYPSFLIATTTNFNVKDVADLVAQAKKSPGKMRYTSAGVGSFPALRHGNLFQTCWRRDEPHSEQDRCGRHAQRPRRRRRAGRYHQLGDDSGDDQIRQAQAARGGRRAARARLSRCADDGRGGGCRGGHAALAEPVRAGRAAEARDR